MSNRMWAGLAAAIAAIAVFVEVVALYRVNVPAWSVASHIAGWPATAVGGVFAGAGCVLLIALVVTAALLLVGGQEVKHS